MLRSLFGDGAMRDGEPAGKTGQAPERGGAGLEAGVLAVGARVQVVGRHRAAGKLGKVEEVRYFGDGSLCCYLVRLDHGGCGESRGGGGPARDAAVRAAAAGRGVAAFGGCGPGGGAGGARRRSAMRRTGTSAESLARTSAHTALNRSCRERVVGACWVSRTPSSRRCARRFSVALELWCGWTSDRLECVPLVSCPANTRR